MADRRRGAGGRHRRRGGTLDADLIDALAAAALCGVPVARIVAGDEAERAVWLMVTERAVAMRDQLTRAHASHVGNEIAKRLK